MTEVFSGPSAFAPHGYCLLWRPQLLLLHGASDLLIVLAYFFISAAILYFLHRKKEVNHKPLFYLFATFIAACGSTHLLGAITLWMPVYYMQGAVMAFTALVSVSTAVYLGPQLPHLLALPSHRQLLQEIDQRRQTESTLQRVIREKEELLTRYRESEARFRNMADSAPVLIWISDSDKLCSYFNQKWLDFTGRTMDQECGNGWYEGVHPDDQEFCMATYLSAFAERRPFTMEYRLRRHDGAYRWILDSAVPRFDEGRSFSGYIGSCVDITERKQAEQTLRVEESLRFTAAIFHASREGMLVTDADGVIVDINPAFTEITGYTLAEIAGKRPNVLGSGRQDLAFYENLWQSIRNLGHWQGEIWNRKKNGELYAEWLTINAIRNEDGSVYRYVALFSDITEKKQLDELIWKQAYFDPLTLLPNRRLFRDRLEQEIRKADRTGLAFALLFVDLDRFKEINDTLGHDVGDLLLVQAANRIRSCVRESDTVARLGGDEFTVILPELKDKNGAEKIASSITRTLSDPFRLSGDLAYVSASIGITVYPCDANSAEDLIRNADQAMYSAKSVGRNGFSYYTSSMQAAAQAKLSLTNDLRAALAGDQFRLYFQPVVDLTTRRIVEAEALLRWQHPQRGLVGPAEFVPLAEETGLIQEIGDRVFKEAVGWARRWNTGPETTLRISVNLSPLQFIDGTRLDHWRQYLKTQDLPGDCIVIEITEGVLLKANTEVHERLEQFQEAGMQISIDDFGTGYSSLSYLNQFEIDLLKIDQSFIGGISPNSREMALTEAIIVMAHKIGLRVIAEGVESTDQEDLLIAAGCDYAQGYLYAAPMPPEQLAALLSDRG